MLGIPLLVITKNCPLDSCNAAFYTCPSITEIKILLESKGFRAIPIKITGPLSDTLSLPVNVHSESGFVIDSAMLEININGELVDLCKSYTSILNSGELKFKGYITKNENICPGNFFTKIDSRFTQKGNSTAAIWFHIMDDDKTDYLYVKWIEYGKPNSDIFGLEYQFHRH